MELVGHSEKFLDLGKCRVVCWDSLLIMPFFSANFVAMMLANILLCWCNSFIFVSYIFYDIGIFLVSGMCSEVVGSSDFEQ